MGRHSSIILTDGQAGCIDEIVKWYDYETRQDFVYSGPAGTGKTSIVPIILDELGLEPDEVTIVAFTGKAASVLMLKGLDASTIHAAFFEPSLLPLYENGKPVIRNGRVVKRIKFVEKQFIDKKTKLIIIDEWSMVNTDMRDVMYKFGIPVLAMGDADQLEPIFGRSPFADRIDYMLTEITRQAKDNGIIQLATLIREGNDLPVYMNFRNNAWVLSKKFLTRRHLLDTDMILTVKNKTRNVFNSKMRDLHGSKGILPNVGDRLLCRKNVWSKSLNGIPLINGTLGRVVNPIRMSECNLKEGIYRIDFQPDYVMDYNYYEALECDYDYLKEPCGRKEINMYNQGAKLEYGEAMTVHSSQGSQFNSIMYWDEFMGDREFMRKLRYTAVTRAVEKAYMFI